jgi:hypothetical protein
LIQEKQISNISETNQQPNPNPKEKNQASNSYALNKIIIEAKILNPGFPGFFYEYN